MRLLLVALPLFCTAAFAGPCVPGTLQNYLDLGAGGCALGGASFADFNIVPGQSFATPIPVSGIQVTPGGSAYSPSLAFALGTAAAAGQLFESIFRFSVTGAPVINFALTLNGSSAAGDGAVTATADICPNGTFGGVTPSGCPNTAYSLIAFKTEYDSLGSASADFAGANSLDVFVDLTADGGLSGSATIDSATVQATTIPEPGTALSLIAGLGALALLRARRRV